MARIIVNNPRQVINGGAKKYYFKVKGLGGPKGDKGDKGDTGSQGPQGPQGNAATVSVGSTTTLPVGYDATVSNSGSIYNAVLNFGIPQGPRGPQGATGAKGDKGDKGEQGNPGPQGEKGTNATVYVGTTSTLNPGSQATVYNSGTDSNAVLNFGIPKGEKGDTGPMPTIAQTTGQAIDQVMSQKATTDALNTKQATITNSSKLSADLVDDTSTTNKFVTAQDKTNWNAKQDALTAGTGIDITSGVISTPAIVPEVVTELPTTGTEGKLYLTPKAHTTSTASGNPIEATVTEQAGQIESFQLDGDTFQQSYTGKNLYYVPDTAEFSKNGLTISAKDGLITVNGTATATTFFAVTNIFSFGTETTNLTLNVIPVSGTWTSGIIGISSRNSSDVQTQWHQMDYLHRSDTKEYTSTTLASTDHVQVYVNIDSVLTNFKFYVQVVKGSTADSDYEPFVGGQPSPSPEYPQQIQTVTGEQTVEIVGKNLFDKSDQSILRNRRISTSTGGTYNENGWSISPLIKVMPGETYTVGGVGQTSYYCLYKDRRYISGSGLPSNGHLTIPSGANQFKFDYPTANEAQIQLEIGSTPTAYMPYSKHTYPINLGSLELCKLGTYQDYIWKDGDDWKVHKKILKTIFENDTGWDWDPSVPRLAYNTANLHIILPPNQQTNAYGLSSKYVARSFEYVYTNKNAGFALSQSGFLSCVDKSWTSEAQAKATIAGTVFYFALRDAFVTDNIITDTNLITQLEAIRTASLENGANTITNTATGTNLAGDMEIGYYGFNPINRYDKFIWLDLNNNYEQIGGE